MPLSRIAASLSPLLLLSLRLDVVLLRASASCKLLLMLLLLLLLLLLCCCVIVAAVAASPLLRCGGVDVVRRTCGRAADMHVAC